MKTSVFGMFVFGLLSSAGVVAGCSTMPKQEARHVESAELRGATPVRAGRAKALVSGPALVRDLATDGAGAVTLYLTDDPGIGDRACPGAAAEGATPIAVLGGESRLTDLLVPEGKRVCAGVSEARAMRVVWRAQVAGDVEGGLYNVALLAR